VQLQNDHSISVVPLFRCHDKNSVRYRWEVPEQKIGEFWLGANSSANSNNNKCGIFMLLLFALNLAGTLIFCSGTFHLYLTEFLS
jgi:hypothetical protein